MRRTLLFSISLFLAFAAFASSRAMPAAETPQAVKQPSAAVAAEPKISALPPARKILKPALQSVPATPARGVAAASQGKVDLRADLKSSFQTDPPIQPGMGSYKPSAHMGKPLSLKAVVENAGATKAENVQVKVVINQATGNPNPFAQKTWEYNYSVSLEGWETVSYPYNVWFPPGMVVISVAAQYPGDEKDKNNNKSVQYVTFQ